jgi:hypothetical protein
MPIRLHEWSFDMFRFMLSASLTFAFALAIAASAKATIDRTAWATITNRTTEEMTIYQSGVSPIYLEPGVSVTLATDGRKKFKLGYSQSKSKDILHEELNPRLGLRFALVKNPKGSVKLQPEEAEDDQSEQSLVRITNRTTEAITFSHVNGQGVGAVMPKLSLEPGATVTLPNSDFADFYIDPSGRNPKESSSVDARRGLRWAAPQPPLSLNEYSLVKDDKGTCSCGSTGKLT